MPTNHTHTKVIEFAGKPIKEASKALIMIHGRGGCAKDILLLSDQLNVKDFALIAPQANNNTWYHYSCMVIPEHNEPWLSSILLILEETVNELIALGISADNIYFLGFSQGACLSLEFVARHAQRYGGVVAFTGGLIGDKIYKENYKGDFMETPIFIGTGDPDEHIPLERVNETASLLKKMNAEVTTKVYSNKPHNISNDEIKWANQLIFKTSNKILS
jgi:phospholipase/carboxylesterase